MSSQINQQPIRRVDLVHHTTLDSKDKTDPYKYGEGTEARPYRYGFASVDRAVERTEKLQKAEEGKQSMAQANESTAKNNSLTPPELRSGEVPKIAKNIDSTKPHFVDQIRAFFDPDKHPGAPDTDYSPQHQHSDIAPGAGAKGVAPDAAYQY